MTKFDTAFLSCRLLSLWILVQAISHLAVLPSAFGVLADPHQSKNFVLLALSYSVFPFVLLATLGVLLWTGAARLTARIMATPPGEKDIPLTRSAVEHIAFTFLGVFLLTQAVPETARQVVTHVLSTQDMQSSAYADFVGKNWELLSRLVLGLWLVLGAPSLSRWLGKVQQPVLDV